jgi:uncharacterized protein (TIGR00299 family) protein
MARIERIHLDPIGGIAGDMFVAAMADAFPEHVAGALAEVAKVCPATPEFVPHSDGLFRGCRFVVPAPGTADHHTSYREIRARLDTAGLEPAVLLHALGLFQLLAEAEGTVHGIAPEKVEFHEVGAWDSIADFVAAAHFIAALSPARWTIGALPLGGGRVRSAHGVMPVPAPATAALLKGLAIVDDGVGGERVTPTGAAIARHLSGQNRHPGEGRGPICTIGATGHGFGTMKLPGMPNLLRVIGFAAAPAMPQPLDEEIATLQFELDDQTAEDLAVALERIREAAGVLDASQAAVYGKKGRLATQVQVLARLEAADAVADLCLAQTTTLGVRISRVWRRTAARAQVQAHVPEAVRVKVASRPTGEMTAKAEMDDIARVPGDRDEREAVRRRAETQALSTIKPSHGRPRKT